MESPITNKSAHFSYGGTFRILDNEGEYLDDSHAATLSDGESNQERTTEKASQQAQSRIPRSIATGRASEPAKLTPSRLDQRQSPNEPKNFEIYLDSHENTNNVKWADEQQSSQDCSAHHRELTGGTVATVTDIESYIGGDAVAESTIERQANRLQHEDTFDWVATSASEEQAYGCNFVGRTLDSFYFVASPLHITQDLPCVNEDLSMENQVMSVLARQHPVPPTVRKDTFIVPDTVKVIKQGSSTTCPDDKCEGGGMTAPTVVCPAGGQRIEDSLEEIDKLEEQLEAMRLATSPHREEDQQDATSRDGLAKRALGKRVSIAPGQAATMRVKPSEKTRPSLRRVNSLTIRNEKPSAPAQQEGSGPPTLTRSKSTIARLSEPKGTTGKPAKPATAPSFELPGEAVSRRLREQRQAREARRAQQAEAEKAAAAPPKPRISRMLPKPTFELPGEAISRRRREEREAKLRAEEEEERKRREFKARPIRSSPASTNLFRGTVVSRTRESMPSLDEIPQVSSKRLSTSASFGRLATSASSTVTSGYRGRKSDSVAADITSRGTSVVTSLSDKRSSVSQEDVAYQRARGRDIYIRDNSYCQEREREKHEREVATKLARAQAAERSRAASREWAEKRRAKEQARLSIRA